MSFSSTPFLHARGWVLAALVCLLASPLVADERFRQLEERLQRSLLPGRADSIAVRDVAMQMLAEDPAAAEKTLAQSLFLLHGPDQSELARILASEAQQLRTFLVLIQLRLQAQGQSAFQLSTALRFMARKNKDSTDWTHQVVEGLPFALAAEAQLAAALVAAAGGGTATALFDALVGTEGPLRAAVIDHIPGVCLGESQLEALLALVQNPRLEYARRIAAYQALERRGAAAAAALARVDLPALEARSPVADALALRPEPEPASASSSAQLAGVEPRAATPPLTEAPPPGVGPLPSTGAWFEAGLCLLCGLAALWAASRRRLLVSVGCLAGTFGFACAASIQLADAISGGLPAWPAGMLLSAGLITGLLAGRRALRIQPSNEPSVPAPAAVAVEPPPPPRPETRRLRAVPGGLFGMRAEPARRALTARLRRPQPEPAAYRMWFQAFDGHGESTTEEICEGVAQEIGREAISFLCRLQLEDQALLKLVIELEPGKHLMAEAEVRRCRPTQPGMFLSVARVLELDPASQARLEAQEQTQEQTHEREPVEVPESAAVLPVAWLGTEADVRTALLPQTDFAEEVTVTIVPQAPDEAQPTAADPESPADPESTTDPESSAEPESKEEDAASVPLLTDSVLLEWEEFLQSVDFEEQTTSVQPR